MSASWLFCHLNSRCST